MRGMAGLGALATSSTSSTVVVPNTPAFDFGAGPFSVELWLRRPIASSSDYALGNTNATTQGWGVSTDSSSRLRLSVSNGTALVQGVVAGTSVVSPDWHHWCLTKSASGTAVYSDGAASSSSALLAGVTVAAATGTFGIGGRVGGSGGLVGWYSEVRLWARALTLAEYQSGWDERCDGTETDLVACWPLDDDTGTVCRELVAGRSASFVSAQWTHPASPLVTVTPPDGGGEPSTPVLLDTLPFVGQTHIDVGAYYYRLTVDTWPDAQSALAIPVGTWLPRLGWVAYLGAGEAARQLERLQFGANELWPARRPCSGLYVHVPAGVSGTVEAWNLV
jgi:Concanavalin A-like lectin/glucanases superfamily